jgi:ubiquinol-cytochrome c reductase cytochrome c1 subunit
MIRILAFLVGLFFTGWLLVSVVMGAVAVAPVVSEHGGFVAPTAEHEFHKHPRKAGFGFEGPFGKFDNAQLQRGFQVYKEVCSACHSLNRLAFRDLQGIGYTEGQTKTIAGEFQVPSINPDTGEAATRKGLPADKFPLVYPNDVAARAANNNAIPPDLTLITKARHDGANYVYSLLTGYQDPPARLQKEFPDSMPGDTTHYNPYFANLNLAMAKPLVSDGQVTYGEGAPKPTVDQMSKDVSAFLAWASEPKQENRKRAGIAVMIFLLIFSVLCWQSYKLIWSEKKGA